MGCRLRRLRLAIATARFARPGRVDRRGSLPMVGLRRSALASVRPLCRGWCAADGVPDGVRPMPQELLDGSTGHQLRPALPGGIERAVGARLRGSGAGAAGWECARGSACATGRQLWCLAVVGGCPRTPGRTSEKAVGAVVPDLRGSARWVFRWGLRRLLSSEGRGACGAARRRPSRRDSQRVHRRVSPRVEVGQV